MNVCSVVSVILLSGASQTARRQQGEMEGEGWEGRYSAWGGYYEAMVSEELTGCGGIALDWKSTSQDPEPHSFHHSLRLSLYCTEIDGGKYTEVRKRYE